MSIRASNVSVGLGNAWLTSCMSRSCSVVISPPVVSVIKAFTVLEFRAVRAVRVLNRTNISSGPGLLLRASMIV